MTELDDLYEALEEAQSADQVASACVLYENILTIEDEENISATLLYIADLIDLGNIGQAESTLLRIEELCEGELEAEWLSAFASLNHHKGRFDEAVKQYRKAHELSSDRGDFLVLAAASAGQAGDLSKAEFLIREALKFQCEQDEAYQNLGSYLAGQRRFAEARDCFLKVLKLDSGNELAAEWIEDLDQVIA